MIRLLVAQLADLASAILMLSAGRVVVVNDYFVSYKPFEANPIAGFLLSMPLLALTAKLVASVAIWLLGREEPRLLRFATIWALIGAYSNVVAITR